MVNHRPRVWLTSAHSGGDQLGGGEVFKCTTNAFEEGDLIRTSAHGLPATDNLMKVSKNFVPVDVSFIKGDKEITRFRQSPLKGVDNDARPLNGGVVYFPRMGLERADQIQMGSRTQEVAIEKRIRRGRAGAEDIGFRSARPRVDRLDGSAEVAGHFRGEFFAAARIGARYEEVLEVANVP